MRIVVQSLGQKPRQAGLAEAWLWPHRICAHSQSLDNAFARQIVSMSKSPENPWETGIVQQRLFHRPSCSITNHLDAISERCNQSCDSIFAVKATQTQHAPVSHPRGRILT